MISLIRNELSKIFHKKGIYVYLILSFIVVLLTNISSKLSNSEENYYYGSNHYIETLREENKNLSLKTEDELTWFVNNKTQIDIYELQEKYGFNSWQASIISEKLFGIINTINYNTYSEIKSIEELETNKTKYNDIIERLDNNDWKSFALEQKEELEIAHIELLNNLNNAKGTREISSAKIQLFQNESTMETLNLRINNDIPFGHDYLNSALEKYNSSKMSINELDNKNDLTYEENNELNNAEKNLEISKYVIRTKSNIYENDSMRGMYKNFYTKYLTLIIAIVLAIAGVIVSEEYNKGTIKLLLIRPFSRSKILLSKFITCIIMILFSIVCLFIFQTIVGYFTYGTSSLSIPIVNYDFNTNSLVLMNWLKHFLLVTITMLPKILLLLTLAFSLGTIFGNSIIAIVLPLVGYFVSELINVFAIAKKIEFMKYWITLNWDFNNYLFGGVPEFKYVDLKLSIIICIIYFLIMIVISLIVFKKKNIKNI